MITVDFKPSAIEYEASKVLKEAFKDRGLIVRHNGSSNTHAPGGKPDVEMYNNDVHINVELTKLLRVAQTNQEATPVATHLDEIADRNPGKKVFTLFVSPYSFERTIRLFENYNERYSNIDNRKIAFMNFTAFNILAKWLATPESVGLTVADFIELLRNCATLSNDGDVMGYINDRYIHIPEISEELKRIQSQKLSEKYSRLDSIFSNIHDDLRSVCGLGPPEAFNELSKLVFLKMYEEQAVIRESEAGRVVENRFTMKYIDEERRRRRRQRRKHPIISLFEEICEEFRDEGLFERGESIVIQADRDEGNYIDDIVRQVEEFSFIDPDVPIADIKGMIYEQFLGLSLRNTDLGQYFTPESIIRFMVQLVDLESNEKVLDPACGTGRFLVESMNEMVSKVEEEELKKRIKERQIFGNEKSPYVTKIAKMNMYVHGDGRANICERDSLDYIPEVLFDVILTNPPLGNINFKKLFQGYEENTEWYDSMEVIEKKEVTRGGVTTKKVTRQEAKGGALFLDRFQHCLRSGGRVATIIDEAILNTDENNHVRDFIKKHFYIKAVVSLTPDTFQYASKTATKTSILYLVKKEDSREQKEPVFFAHAFKVGVNAKGKACENELIDSGLRTDIYREYKRFEEAVNINKENNGGEFMEEGFGFEAGTLESVRKEKFSSLSYFAVPYSELQDRLEFKWYDPTYNEVEKAIEDMDTIRFGDIVDKDKTNYGLTETGLEYGDIPFINIENLIPDTRIDLRGVRYVNKNNKKIRPQHYTEANDILISRARLPGIAAVVSDENERLIYGSYIIRFHLNEEQGSLFIPEYVALFINSIFGQTQVHRLKSGSNGYNINSGQLGDIKILKMSRESQREIIDRFKIQSSALAKLGTFIRKFQEISEIKFIESCIGQAGRENVEEMLRGLDSKIDAVRDFLNTYESSISALGELEKARIYFEIRPTFYTKFATEE